MVTIPVVHIDTDMLDRAGTRYGGNDGQECC